MGSIELRVFRIKEVVEEERASEDEIEGVKVHEDRKLKLSHQTSFGPARDAEEIDITTINCFESEDPPYASFIFKYRSRDFLELEGLAPPLRDASTPPIVVSPELTPAPHATAAAASTSSAQQITVSDEQANYISSSDDDEEAINAAFAEMRRRRSGRSSCSRSATVLGREVGRDRDARQYGGGGTFGLERHVKEEPT